MSSLTGSTLTILLSFGNLISRKDDFIKQYTYYTAFKVVLTLCGL